MRWPFSKRETRASDGYTDLLLANQFSQASGATVDASSTAAVEAVSGALSRAFASARVDGASWVQDVVTPSFLSQVGRDLIRRGSSLHALRMSNDMLLAVPISSWDVTGDHDPAAWMFKTTAYGPTTSHTWNLPSASVIFVRWGSSPGRAYEGHGPTAWANTTAKLSAEAEQSLANEAAGPLAQLIAVPQDGGDGSDTDPLKSLKSDITGARGKALLVETTAAAWDQGKAAAPQKDWSANRLGPSPPDAMVAISKDAFARMLAACGCSPALFDDSDGTSKREALRQWFMGTVKPLAHLLETELSQKLETPVKLVFDAYPLDLAGRAQAFQKLVAGGVGVGEALMTAGLLSSED